MPASWSVTVQAQDWVTPLQKATANLAPVFRGPINRSVTGLFRRQFNTEGREGGHPWPQLKASTIAARAKRGRGRGGILQDVRRMWGAYVKEGRGPEAILVIEKMRYERGVSVPYARFHQSGTKRMPRRPVVPDTVPRKYLEGWARLVARHLESSVKPGPLGPVAEA